MDAARRAHERGLAVIAAAQAVVEPTDPPSEVSPLALIELGLCDALASGSRPNALLDAMSLLVLRGVRDLRGAVELVTAGPAAAAGLHDRGRLTPGCRADIALLRPHRERFHVDRAFRAGRRAASAAIS
jgi:alpha-D-ribose 1-methylphosphonate 5-triphosphate diphosphatase